MVKAIAKSHNVEFDVGLTYGDKTDSIEGIGVFLGSISLGKKNDTNIEQTAVTKVRFSIPLVLPKGHHINDDGYKKARLL